MMNKTILITGSNGLLGQKLVHLLKQKYHVVATSLGYCLISNQYDFIYQSLDITEEKDILQEMYDRRDEVYENLDKKEQVKNKKRELFTYIEDNKAILDEFKQTKNKQLIKDLVFNNVRNVHREARTISQIENEIIEMNYYKDENIYKVYKFPMLFHKSEINLGEPEVVKNFER